MWTFVPLVCVMYFKVSHLGSGVGEGPITEVAMVRLLPTVHQVVAFQVARCGEEFAAHFAAVPCLTSVALAMQVE